MKIRSAVLLTASLLAVGEVSVVAAQEADSADDGPLADADRAWIASRVYRGVELNFGHWDDVPGYDLSVEYREYLGRAMGAADRRGFSLATQEFVASLGNSHTYFSDRALYEHAGPSHGYTVRYLEGDWVVIRSRRPELSAGDVIVSVDEEPIEVFYDRKTHLPVGIKLIEAGSGNRKTARLDDAKRNPELTEAELAKLSIEEPDATQWRIDVRPLERK